MREITERDIRRPEFADAKLEDLEFDGTGEVVRKDRWEMAIRSIVGMLEDHGHATIRRRQFNIPEVLGSVKEFIRGREYAPTMGHVDLARKILAWQGRSVSPSREPGADQAVDRLSEVLALALPPSAVGEPDRDSNLLEWAVASWKADVRDRPLVNMNRRPLDDVWRQVIRFAGGDPDVLLGPSHDVLVTANKELPE